MKNIIRTLMGRGTNDQKINNKENFHIDDILDNLIINEKEFCQSFLNLRFQEISNACVLFPENHISNFLTGILNGLNKQVQVCATFDEVMAAKIPKDNDIIFCSFGRSAEEWDTIYNVRTGVESRVLIFLEIILPALLLCPEKYPQISELKYYCENTKERMAYYGGKKYNPIAQLYGGENCNPIEQLNNHFQLSGKKIIEFGPLEGYQTAALRHYGVKHIKCIEARPENVLKMQAVKKALEWENVEIVMNDFHNVHCKNAGEFDLAFAHGVFYHTIEPFVFFRNLVSLSRNVYVGTFVATDDDPPQGHEILSFQGDSYKVKRWEEREYFTSGINTHSYFFYRDDLLRLFEKFGHQTIVLSDEILNLPKRCQGLGGQYIRFFASRN